MTCLVFDSNNLAYRCKYTYSLTNHGEDVSVTYGVIASIVAEVTKHNANSVVMCWDSGIPQFRKDALPEYKAHRHKNDNLEDVKNFKRQLGILQAVLPFFGVSSIRLAGWEADDVAYVTAKSIMDDVIVITTDEDMLQVVDDTERIEVYNPIKKDFITYANFSICMGIRPEQYVDYKCMVGDSSDNIKGIPGVGDKLAKELLSFHSSIEDAWYTHDEDQAASSLAYTRIHKVDMDYIKNLRRVIDLSDINGDLYCGILDELDRWTPYNHEEVRKFLLRNAFVSMMDGKLRNTMEKLTRPLYEEE